MRAVIARYSEIGTKSTFVRRKFERMLRENIRAQLLKSRINFEKVKNENTRVMILGGDEEEVIKEVCGVFGVASCSVVEVLEYNLEKIKELAVKMYNDESEGKKTTFRITAKRSDKGIELSSQEMACEVGAFVVEKTGAKVRLKDADIDINIDAGKTVYMFTSFIEGPGGMPIGTQDKVLCRVENRMDALACGAMMRRGCKVVVVDGGCKKELLEELKYAYSNVRELEIVKEVSEKHKELPRVYSCERLDKIDSLGKNGLEIYPLSFGDREMIKVYESKIFKK